MIYDIYTKERWFLAPVAQWIEHLASDQGVVGSTPAGCAKGYSQNLPLSIYSQPLKSSMIKFFRDDHPRVSAFFSERSDGPMGRNNDENNSNNQALSCKSYYSNKHRKKLLKKLGIIPEQVVGTSLTHGINAVIIDEARGGFYGEGDGIATKEVGICLTVTAADCAAVYFYDPQTGISGICHAGWKGIRDGVVGNTILKMQELGGVAGRMHCAISPMIGRCCFEVGREVAEEFPGKYSHKNKENEQKYFLDLKSLIRDRLVGAGVSPDRIEINPDCTKCNRVKYFSYRGGDDPARGEVMLAGIITKSGQ